MDYDISVMSEACPEKKIKRKKNSRPRDHHDTVTATRFITGLVDVIRIAHKKKQQFLSTQWPHFVVAEINSTQLHCTSIEQNEIKKNLFS